MPSGPTGLHEYWCDYGPHRGWGDQNAMIFLKDRGWKLLVPRYEWVKPSEDYEPTKEDLSAISYLILEWDYCGIYNRPQTD